MREPRPTVRANLRALPRPAWILFGGSFLNRFGSFVLVFLVLYLTRKGYSLPQAGAAVSSYGVGNVAASLGGGILADRFGRRRTIVLSMFSSAAAMLLLSQAPTLPLILLLSALAGLTSELYRPASSALLADLIPAGRRVTAFAVYRFAINLGFAAGPAVAGLLARHSFFLLFLGDAITSTAFGVVALLALPEGARAPHAGERRGELLRTLRRDRPFLLFLVASTATAFVFFQSQSTFPLQVTRSGFSPAVYGALISLNGLVIVCVELPLTAVTQRLPVRPTIALGSLLAGAGFGLYAIAHTVPLLAAGVVVWTFGEMVNAPVASAYVAGLAPAHLRGRYMGAWSFTWGLALVLAPTIGTALFAWSPTGLWLVCLGLGAAAAALVLLGARHRDSPRALSK